MSEATARGHRVTYDWLDAIEQAGTSNDGLTEAEQRMHSRKDLSAILKSDLVWMLAPRSITRGGWVEFGFALGRSIPTVISGVHRKKCIYHALAARSVQDSQALDAIEELLRDQGKV